TLITGAAGGIGSEICNILADLGSDIIMADRNQDKLIILKEKLRRKHVKVHIINIDISSELSISQCIDQIFKKVGFLNMVVHGAGFFSPFNLDDIPAKDQSELFIANIFGPYMLSEKILEHWTHKPGKKKMLYISSIAGLENNPQKRQAYAFSKRMNIEIFHRNITKFANQKIDFVCACPGPTNTKMWKKVCKTIAEYEDITPEEVLDKYQRSSSNRVWEPRDTAYAIVDCLIGGKNGELFNIDNHSIIKYNPDYNTKELMSIINSMRFIP
ncbi:MAG: SDR family oxidoreductase, partial [Nanoarchaeota archaeon]|nr:SDR family oxidoreductase [Nanoarchaeota archaeon]